MRASISSSPGKSSRAPEVEVERALEEPAERTACGARPEVDAEAPAAHHLTELGVLLLELLEGLALVDASALLAVLGRPHLDAHAVRSLLHLDRGRGAGAARPAAEARPGRHRVEEVLEAQAPGNWPQPARTEWPLRAGCLAKQQARGPAELVAALGEGLDLRAQRRIAEPARHRVERLHPAVEIGLAQQDPQVLHGTWSRRRHCGRGVRAPS